jgi:replicative DNA helicase
MRLDSRGAEGVEKLLPQNIEAECGVLGSIIIDPEAIVQVADFLQTDDFYRDAHRTIYQTILQLYEHHKPADYITICDALERMSKLEEVGGASYITSLINQVPTSGNIEYYGRIVERTAILRRLIYAAGQIAAMAYEDGDADVVLDKAEQLIFAISQRHARADFSTLDELLSLYVTKLDQLHDRRGSIVGVPTGFTDLDRLTGGLQRSDLIILAARPSIGKTSLGLSIAHNSATKHGQSIAVFSLEMSKEQLVQRLLAMGAGVDHQRLRTGWVEDDEWSRITHTAQVLSGTHIWIDDTPGISTMEMRSKARRLQAEHPVDLIIVDYLQLMQSSIGGRRNENRVQEISEISRNLKELARELDVPVMALAQLSRQVETRQSKIPQLSDLRESGCLAAETLVYLPDEGIYRPIEQLVGQTDFRVLALNTQTWKLEPHVVTNTFATGRKPVYKLTTRLGRTIRATANHKFLTIHGWKRLDELTQGERIALPRYLPGPTQATMSNDELALLGHLIGDGCTLPRHAIQYTTNDETLAKEVTCLAISVFGDKVVPRTVKELDWYQVYLAANDHLTHNKRNPVAAWLDELGVFGLRSYEKYIPRKVFAQPAESIAIFLRHLWSTDGCIHLSHGKDDFINIYYGTSSAILAQHVQSLLLRLSINAKVSRIPQTGKGRDQYHVRVSGKPEIESFLKQIGGLGEKKKQHQAAIIEHLAQRQAKTNRDIIPYGVWDILEAVTIQTAVMVSTQRHKVLAKAYPESKGFMRNFNRERAAQVALLIQSECLAKLAYSDVYWDEINAIDAIGDIDVYDITVKNMGNFVANDYFVHNSIEQDADIVMFIYREDVYNPETERKNIADIIVAKHRNGPVGDVSLYFQASHTRFCDLEITSPTDEQWES